MKYGLIQGRHPMPVDAYIFEVIEDVFDFAGMESHIRDFISTSDETELAVYVTGLTAVTAALIKVCAQMGVGLTLYHFNLASGEYVPQLIF